MVLGGVTLYRNVQSLDLMKTKKLLDGDLAQIGDTVNHLDTTVKQLDYASREQQQYLEQWNQQVTQAMGHTNELLVSLKNTSEGINRQDQEAVKHLDQVLDTANSTVAGIQPIESSLSAEIDQTKQLTAGLTSLTPDLQITADHLKNTSSETEDTMANLRDTTGDVKQAVHSWTHPGWVKKIWNGVLDVAHVFNPL